MPSVGMQMPKLYMRGSLCNKTMVNLENKQILELSDIVDEIINEPLLQPTRIEFRNALKYTIKSDYQDIDAADQEYQIAIWKAATAAKFGWGDHEPTPIVLEDRIQKKKYFQTWVFNYLRQILNENKKPSRKSVEIKQIRKIDACKSEVIKNLHNFNVELETNIECNIQCDLYLLPSKNINQLSRIKSMYFNKGIELQIIDNKIIIKDNQDTEGYEMTQVETQTPINTISTFTDDEHDDFQIEITDTQSHITSETIQYFMQSLSEDAQEVIKLIINPTDQYIEKYGNKPIKKYIAEYLNLSTKQVKDIWFELKIIYCEVVGTPSFV